MVHEITSDDIKPRDFTCRFGLPILSRANAGLFQKPVQEIAMMQLLDTPTVHELSDYWIFTSGRTSQLLIIHISEVFDVAHVDEHRDKRRIDRIVFNLIPADAVDVLL